MPRALTDRSNGHSHELSNHEQHADRVEGERDHEHATPELIVASDRAKFNHNRTNVWFEGVVELDGTFEIDAQNDEHRLGGNTYIHIFDLDGNLLQELKFHTSCSEPLNSGDQFGSIVLTGFTPQDDDDHEHDD